MTISKITGIAIIGVLVLGGILVFMRMSNIQNNTATSRETMPMEEKGKTTIVDAASASAEFSTLVAAVKAADLVDALSADNKLTVFAPKNAAFEKLPSGTVDTLLMPENKEVLQGILTYHVVEGEVLSSQLQDGQKVKTLNGDDLTISLENGSAYIIDAKGGKAMVTQADMKVDNGVIHAIDSVVMPE